MMTATEYELRVELKKAIFERACREWEEGCIEDGERVAREGYGGVNVACLRTAIPPSLPPTQRAVWEAAIDLIKASYDVYVEEHGDRNGAAPKC